MRQIRKRSQSELAWSLHAHCPSVYALRTLLRVLRMEPLNQLSGVRPPRQSTDTEPHQGTVRFLEELHCCLQLVIPPDLLYSFLRRFAIVSQCLLVHLTL